MKKYILILLFGPTLLTAQTLLSPNRVWKNHHTIYPQGHKTEWDVYYSTMIDTPINGLSYSKVVTDKQQTFFLRTSGKKVYLLKDSVDVLLYDFDFKLGDSVTVTPKYGSTYYYKYSSEDSLLVNGVFEKRIAVSTNFNHPHYTSPYVIYWLNAVGDTYTGLLSLYAIDLGFGPDFVCLKEDNLSIYGSNCNATGIVDQASHFENMEVYMSAQKLHIRLEKPLMQATVILYNVEGKEVLSAKMGSIMSEDISIPAIPAGVYLVRIFSETVNTVRRVVKL
jgi:hypothetical protein